MKHEIVLILSNNESLLCESNWDLITPWAYQFSVGPVMIMKDHDTAAYLQIYLWFKLLLESNCGCDNRTTL